MPARARCVWSKSEIARQTCSERFHREQMMYVRHDQELMGFVTHGITLITVLEPMC